MDLEWSMCQRFILYRKTCAGTVWILLHFFLGRRYPVHWPSRSFPFAIFFFIHEIFAIVKIYLCCKIPQGKAENHTNFTKKQKINTYKQRQDNVWHPRWVLMRFWRLLPFHRYLLASINVRCRITVCHGQHLIFWKWSIRIVTLYIKLSIIICSHQILLLKIETYTLCM